MRCTCLLVLIVAVIRVSLVKASVYIQSASIFYLRRSTQTSFVFDQSYAAAAISRCIRLANLSRRGSHVNIAMANDSPSIKPSVGSVAPPLLRPRACKAIEKIEGIISKDEGGRGMAALVVPGDLRSAAETLARLRGSPAHVLVLSGFPCCVDQSPPTETDGPPGTLAIARAVVGLGHRATIVTDDCNGAVFRAASLDIGPWASSVVLETFPSEEKMTSEDTDRMTRLANSADLVCACERAGPAADGHCYTMRGIDMNEKRLIAPLHHIIEIVRTQKKGVRFVAIGDGGNEMGMGKVIEAVVNVIRDGAKIGAVTKADDLIAASVSNWGGYALSAAAAVVRCNDEHAEAKDWVERCLPSDQDEISLLNRCVEAGCRDGVSGKMEATVDGMPLETSLECLRAIRTAALEMTALR